MNSGKFSFRARMESFRFAFHGLWSLLKNEHNSRIHLLAAIIAVVTGIVLKINSLEWCLLAIVIGLVFITELLNSSIETIADIIDPELNEKIKKSKDYAAGSVLISAIIAVIAGGIIFIPKIIAIF
jgi:diacylglycerol kinase (ATP)